MNRFLHIISLLWLILLLYSCTGTRRFGTTIERDENNPCQVNMIIQIAVEGTDEDVTAIKSDLDACFGKGCFIPCPNDSSKGCMTKVTTVVKKYGSIPQVEAAGYHYVQMVDQDGLPSNAYIGTPNNGASQGIWRRNEPLGVYCHEVLHFCGLEDKYCSRKYDPVKDSVIVERNCEPPPDPGGNCCSPNAANTRCGTACSGHEQDLMGTIDAALSCENIMDVLRNAGFNNCPPECCGSGKTFTRPPDEVHILPGYYHFGDKNEKFGSVGVNMGYTKYLDSKIGLSIEGGYYHHSEKDDEFKKTQGLMQITGGVSYGITGSGKDKKGISITAHALLGISRWTQKSVYVTETYKEDATSFHFNTAVSINMDKGGPFSFRLLRADYAPTFFYKNTQHNFRLSTGVVLKIR